MIKDLLPAAARLRRAIKLGLILFLWPAAASAQTLLRYTDHEPLGGMRTRFLQDVFFAAVEKESHGRLRIEAHWNSELATGYDALRVLQEGRQADLGIVVPEYTAEALPLHQLFKSFPVGPTGDAQVAFWRRVDAEVPALAAELGNHRLTCLFFATGYPVAFFSTRPLPSLAAIRGEKWRTASFWHSDFLQHAGATAVSMPWGKGIFDALQARTLDGLIVNVDSGYDLKVHEAAPHVLASRDLWLGHVYLLVMNTDTWEHLAPEDRAAIGRAAETAYKSLGAVMDASFDAMIKELKDKVGDVHLLTAEEVASFAEASKYREVQAAWVAAQEAKGVRDVGATLQQVSTVLAEAMQNQAAARAAQQAPGGAPR